MADESKPELNASKPLRDLAKSVLGPTAGTTLGLTAAAQHPIFALLTVPVAIVLIYAAVGVGEALRLGLARKIERLLD